MSLYSKIVDDITNKISNMEKGDKIPSERQLCVDYNVSRTTVRNAIAELVSDGLIIQIQGKGSFVTGKNKREDNLSNYYSFTQRTIQKGMVPKSEILDFRIKKASLDISDAMNLKHEDLLIMIIRLRLADNEPMMYETTYIPYEIFKDVSKEIISKKPLYDIFDERNHSIYSVNERFSVDKISAKVAKFLKQTSDAPCLKIIRKSKDFEDRIIEYTLSFARGDKFYYETEYNPR